MRFLLSAWVCAVCLPPASVATPIRDLNQPAYFTETISFKGAYGVSVGPPDKTAQADPDVLSPPPYFQLIHIGPDEDAAWYEFGTAGSTGGLTPSVHTSL